MFLKYFENDRVVHSLKTALACLIGFAITKSVHFYVDQWLIVTIIVVMCAQMNVGSVFQKAYMRFLGTMSGSIIAALTLALFGDQTIVFAVIIPLAALIFSYIATGQKSYVEAGTLGAVTVVIILIAQNPTPLTALQRFIEISLGILIAALISQFVLPIHARQHLRQIQAKTLRKLHAFYLTTLSIDPTTESSVSYQEQDEDIALSLIKQRKLATDSARELLGETFDLQHFRQLLQTEKEILRCIVAMHHASQAMPDGKKIFSELELLRSFHAEICEALVKIATCIETKKGKKVSIQLPNIKLLRNDIFSHTKNLSMDDRVYIDAFLFSAEVLIDQLLKLVELVGAVNSGER